MQHSPEMILDTSTLIAQMKVVDFAAARAKNVSMLMQQLIKTTKI